MKLAAFAAKALTEAFEGMQASKVILKI
jgi:hypothetical protein